jgi:hypothetical protein
MITEAEVKSFNSLAPFLTILGSGVPLKPPTNAREIWSFPVSEVISTWAELFVYSVFPYSLFPVKKFPISTI